MSTAAGVASAAAALYLLIELGQVGADLLEKVGQRREPPRTSARTTSVISMLVTRAPADRCVRFTYALVSFISFHPLISTAPDSGPR